MSSSLEISTRRLSNSSLTKQFYSAVCVINGQRQAANKFRICRYMERQHGIKQADCVAQLELCVRDGLLICKQTVKKKGPNKGAIRERYVVNVCLEKDGYDWYCFECHKSGEVIRCSTCHRVFHIDCTTSVPGAKFSCYICRGQNKCIPITKEKLNRLLGYLCKRARELVPNKLKKWKNSELDKLLMSALLFKKMDINIMFNNLMNLQYSHWMEFEADAKNFLHNTVLLFGEKDPLTQKIKGMLEYCLHDIKEIELCADCYEASNARTDKLWFCKPCKPLHKLVLAKMEASPFWPAKVICEFNDTFDVRFFGSRHSRGVVSKASVIPIPACVKCIKKLPKYGRTPSWKRALEELIMHVICIGPQLILERLSCRCNVQNIFQETDPNSQRGEKRKVCGDDPGRKKIRCHEDIVITKKEKELDICDDLVRQVNRCDKEGCDIIMNNNIGYDEGNSVQEVIAKDVPNFQSYTNITTEIQDVNVPEKTDSTKFASHTEADSVSLSEFHEEIDIKDEFEHCFGNEHQTNDQTEIVDTTGMNVNCSDVNSEQIVKEVGFHSSMALPKQQTETFRSNVPKEDDSLNLTGQLELASEHVPLAVVDSEIIIKKKSEDKSKYQMLSDSNDDVQNIPCHANSEENGSGSEHEMDMFNSTDTSISRQEIVTKTHTVKEEALCSQCSSLDLITRTEAEKIKTEAVAKTVKHYVALIARMQDDGAQENRLKNIPGHKDAN